MDPISKGNLRNRNEDLLVGLLQVKNIFSLLTLDYTLVIVLGFNKDMWHKGCEPIRIAF